MIRTATAAARPFVVCATVIAMLSGVPALAQKPTYKCKDTSGQTIYSDKLCSYSPGLVDITDNGGSASTSRNTPAPDPRHYFKTSGEPVSLNFQNIEMGSLMQVLSDFSGKRLVVDPSLRRSVNIRVDSMPWHLALMKVTTDNGMAVFKVRDTTFLIIPTEMSDQTASARARQMGL